MNVPLVMKALHIFGALLWVGGLAFVGVLGMSVEEGELDGRKLARALRVGMLARVATGMILAWVAGLAVLVPSFSTYIHFGWVHAKLTAVVALSGVSGALSAHLRKAAEGAVPLAPGKIRTLSLVAIVLAAAIVVLATLKPF